MTPSERKLWSFIRYKQILGYGFRRQFTIAGFILDFYCPKLKLGIEVDGNIHILNKENDQNRDRILSEHSVTILRFSNQEIDLNIHCVIEKIERYIKSKFPFSS